MSLWDLGPEGSLTPGSTVITQDFHCPCSLTPATLHIPGAEAWKLTRGRLGLDAQSTSGIQMCWRLTDRLLGKGNPVFAYDFLRCYSVNKYNWALGGPLHSSVKLLNRIDLNQRLGSAEWRTTLNVKELSGERWLWVKNWKFKNPDASPHRAVKIIDVLTEALSH